MDATDQPSSICHVQTIQMYQLPPPPTQNLSDLTNPSSGVASSSNPAAILQCFKLLVGEAIFHHGTSVDGLIILTNFRLYLQSGDNHHHIPLGLIEIVEHRDLFYLQIGCKDARSYRVIFATNEACLDWFDRISKSAEAPKQLEQIFAFYHYIWSKNRANYSIQQNNAKYTFDFKLFKSEMERLEFEGDSWRISEANKAYKLCPTYPPYLIVPSCINDETLECVAKFRSSRRIPAVVWRHRRNGAVIARCSQPEVGWLGWRSSEDEDLIKAISQACNFDQRADKESILSHSPISDCDSMRMSAVCSKEKKVLIMDARSYTTAVANRARGGGCECPEYYPNCEIQFMNLANIHSIRKSFHALRLLCTAAADQPTWFSQLEGTRWLQHMSGLMKAAVTLVNAVDREARPVLVHCSDGWDRTPQIIALAELLLDPFYRTIDGFRILIEREWLAFGHKFADRCGHSTGSDDQNERCPVFLQWLDCVHQLLIQFPCAFEFSQTYLVKLAQHIYSNLYGTFLSNTFQERMRIVNGKTFSVWEFLTAPQFKNHLYYAAASQPHQSPTSLVLWPQCNVRDMQLWTEVFLGAWEAHFTRLECVNACPGPPASTTSSCGSSSPSIMVKTRSYGDLKNANFGEIGAMRRSSDPSINIDNKMCENEGENGFLCRTEVEEDCNNDCIFKLNGGGGGDEEEEEDDDEGLVNGHVIDKTDVRKGVLELRIDCDDCHNNGPSNILNVFNDNDSEDNDATERSGGSKSENTLCEFNVERSIETSTDTLVSENPNTSSSPLEVNGFEKLQTPTETDTIDGCKVCAQNIKFVNDSHSTKDKPIHSPVYSRTSSTASGWDNGLPQHKTLSLHHGYNLGDDGLIPVQSVAQERLWQIIEEYRRKEELLEKELHTYRQALINQFCHKCSNSDCERADETSDTSDSESSNSGSCKSLVREKIPSPISMMKSGSVVESVGSVGEGQASAIESLRSDLSWEALEENILSECTATLWVPDHAVSRCTGCQTEFWVGKRKHHCRKCGRIFCASCSENSTPLPSEQLYEPVRVCTGCYSKLRRDCDDLPEICKHGHHHHTTNTNPQITASSN